MGRPLDYLADHKRHSLYPQAVAAVEMTEHRYGAQEARRKAIDIAEAMTDSSLERRLKETKR